MKNSLKKNEDFKKVFDEKKSCANKYLILYYRENELDVNRLGIQVSKKVGNSVVRHRLSRLIRESFRLNENSFKHGLDLVVIARGDAKGKTYKEIEDALLHLGKQSRILSEN
ncbi:MAG: ribonuclease P protein component [Eubacterium sp.]|nr:ribonuclease P protein component [Eubacterium sp.]